MEIVCETTNVFYPLLADIYYPSVEQGAYGNVSKVWMLDATLACFFGPAGRKYMQEVKPNVQITQNSSLVGRTRSDIRISSRAAASAITNIIITNIRDTSGTPVYVETAGPRAGKSTIFEIATNDPIVGPFGKIEYYKVVIRRSENQGVDV
jgi:hypothetical protein